MVAWVGVAFDQAGGAEGCEVLADEGLACAECLGELGGGAGFVGESPHDLLAAPVGEQVERGQFGAGGPVVARVGLRVVSVMHLLGVGVPRIARAQALCGASGVRFAVRSFAYIWRRRGGRSLVGLVDCGAVRTLVVPQGWMEWLYRGVPGSDLLSMSRATGRGWRSGVPCGPPKRPFCK